jgi:hypothetical protein
MWNKILLAPIHLVIFSSKDDDGLVRWRSTGFAEILCRSDGVGGTTQGGLWGSYHVCDGHV